jgi:hypothetical protein
MNPIALYMPLMIVILRLYPAATIINYNQKLTSCSKGIKTVGHRFAIIANHYFPLSKALCTKGSYVIMPTVKLCSIPLGALLKRYQKSGFHTDCYTIDVPACVSQEQFVLAFYSTKLFKLERFILKWMVSRPSTEGQLARLASGEASEFAAWSVEDKSENQLLLSDFQGRTRSWLMTKFTVPLQTTTQGVITMKDKNIDQEISYCSNSIVSFNRMFRNKA